MEGDKEAYLEEASKALKRQRKNIEELAGEKTYLIRQLRVTKSRQNRNKDAENAAKIARLAEEQDTLGIMIKREMQSLKSFDGEITRLIKRWLCDTKFSKSSFRVDKFSRFTHPLHMFSNQF